MIRTIPLRALGRRALLLVAAALTAACAHHAPATAVPIPTSTVDMRTTADVMLPAPASASRGGTGGHDVRVLQQFVDSLVALPQFGNMQWGILLVAPERRDTLASVNADRLFLPASNMKLVTAAVALARLGPDFTWTTTFTRTGPVHRGVLHGDIVVAGTGDPSISSAMRRDPLEAFAPVVAALKAAGVMQITGRVRASDTPAFPGSPLGFGWDWDDLHEPYGAGITELMWNEAFTDVQVRGCGRAGRGACITTTPLRTSPVVHADVRVRAAGSGPPEIAWWRDSAATPGITVRGSIAAGDSMTFSAAQPDGRATYLAAVAEAVTRAGIGVRQHATAAARVGTRDLRADTIVVLQSLPLRDVLVALQKPSQNQIAESMFRTLALHGTGVGTPDSARAIVERQLLAWGARADAHAIRDGSGLSRHDYLSPRLLVQVLDTMRRRSDFSVYHDALPIAGVDGTLRNRMQQFAQGRVHAKTGTIDKARAISGYVTTADGEMLLFSMIANNHTVPNREVERVQDLIIEQLVNLRRPVAP